MRKVQEVSISMTEQVEDKQYKYVVDHNTQARLNRHDIRRLTFALPMLVVGGIALLFSYIYTSLILTFIGLGLTFWGSVIYYITSSRYYPAYLFRAVVEAYSKSIDSTLSSLGYNIDVTKAVLFYPRQLRLGGLTQGYIFISKDGMMPKGNTIQLGQYIEGWDGQGGNGGSSSNTIGSKDTSARGATPAAASTPVNQYSGMLIKAPAQGLIDLFESRLDSNFALMSMDELSMSIERLFIEEFMLADRVEISIEDDTVRVTVKGRDTAMICSSIHGISTALCPICSSIALAVSKSTGKAVMVKESSIGKRRVDTVYSLLEVV